MDVNPHSFAGLPENKGPHGNKFTVEDTFNDTTVKIYLTMYRTGKLLVQAEKSKHSINLHFLNTHLENLFTQVYKKNTNQKTLHNQDKLKTPITKPVKTAGRISLTISSCQLCNLQTTDPSKLRKHKKKEHTMITSKNSEI